MSSSPYPPPTSTTPSGKTFDPSRPAAARDENTVSISGRRRHRVSCARTRANIFILKLGAAMIEINWIKYLFTCWFIIIKINGLSDILLFIYEKTNSDVTG